MVGLPRGHQGMDHQEDRNGRQVDRQQVLTVRGSIQQAGLRKEGEDVRISIAAEGIPGDEAPPPPPDAPPTIRSFYIKTSNIAQHGFTPHCKGCVAIRLRKAPRTHRRVQRTHREHLASAT